MHKWWNLKIKNKKKCIFYTEVNFSSATSLWPNPNQFSTLESTNRTKEVKLMSISPSLGFQQAFTMDLQNDAVSKPISVLACIAMALLYVATLYAPTFLLRLPPPSSFTNFMIRRFLCAVVSTTISLFLTPLIIPVCMLPLFFHFFTFQPVNHLFYCSFFSNQLAYLNLLIAVLILCSNVCILCSLK